MYFISNVTGSKESSNTDDAHQMDVTVSHEKPHSSKFCIFCLFGSWDELLQRFLLAEICFADRKTAQEVTAAKKSSAIRDKGQSLSRKPVACPQNTKKGDFNLLIHY